MMKSTMKSTLGKLGFLVVMGFFVMTSFYMLNQAQSYDSFNITLDKRAYYPDEFISVYITGPADMMFDIGIFNQNGNETYRFEALQTDSDGYYEIFVPAAGLNGTCEVRISSVEYVVYTFLEVYGDLNASESTANEMSAAVSPENVYDETITDSPETIPSGIDFVRKAVIRGARNSFIEYNLRITNELNETVYKIQENESYDVEMTSGSGPVTRIVLLGLEVVDNETINLGIDDVSEMIPGPNGWEWEEIYAIDPSRLNFSDGYFTAEAKGNELYKCRDWDFMSQACMGSWVKVMDIVPGQEYNVTLTKDDPAFGEINITVINVQSYPTLGGNWTVEFATRGTADLYIRAVDRTVFGEDLEFLELWCGDTKLEPEFDGETVSYPDYYCDGNGRETSMVLTGGRHTLEFTFGDDADYAHNLVGERQVNMVEFFAGSYSGDGTNGQSSNVNYSFSGFNFTLYEDDVDVESAFVVFQSMFGAYADPPAVTGYTLAFDTCQSPCTSNPYGTYSVSSDDSATLAYDESESNFGTILLDVTSTPDLIYYNGEGVQLNMTVGYGLKTASTVTNFIASAKAKLIVTYSYNSDSGVLTKTVIYPLESTASGDQGTRGASQADDCTRNTNCPLFNYSMNVLDYSSTLSQWFAVQEGNDGNAANDVMMNVNIQGTDVNSENYVHECANGGTQGFAYQTWYSGVQGFQPNVLQSLEVAPACSAGSATHYTLGGEVFLTYNASATAPVKTKTVMFPMGVVSEGSVTTQQTASTTVYLPEKNAKIIKAWLRITEDVTDTDGAQNMNVSTKVGNNAVSGYKLYNSNVGGNVVTQNAFFYHVIPSSDYAELQLANATTEKNVTVYVRPSLNTIRGISAVLMVTYNYTDDSSGYMSTNAVFAGQEDSTSNFYSTAAGEINPPFPETTGTKTLRGAALYSTYIFSDTGASMPGTQSDVDANISIGSCSTSNAFDMGHDSSNAYSTFYKKVTDYMNANDAQTYTACYSNFHSTDAQTVARHNGVLYYTYQWDDSTPPKWYEASVNDTTPLPGETVDHKARWTDNSQLGYYVLEWNATGAACDGGFSNVTNGQTSGTNAWINVSLTIPSACEGRVIGWRQYVNDTAGNLNATDTFEYKVSAIPPYYQYDSDNSSGSVNDGVFVGASVYWNDNSQLNYAILRTNETGSWVNSSYYAFASTPGYSNFSVETAGHPGETVCWVVWANDTSGGMNASMAEHCFYVNDVTPPGYEYDGDDSGGLVTEGDDVHASAYWDDDVSLKDAVLRTNETGSWVNSSYYSFASTPGYSNFTVETVGHAGETMCWVMWANDTTGNFNALMSEHCFDVNEPPQVNLVEFNDTSINQNQAVNLTVNVTDPDGVVAVIATFQYPDLTTVNVTLDYQGGDNYTTVWDDTGVAGWYNVTVVYASDSLGGWNATTWVTGFFVSGDAPPTSTLNAPANGNVTRTTTTVVFNCTGFDEVDLVNVSLWGSWSGGWHKNETNASGYDSFDYLFTKEIGDGDYLWNCEVCDSFGQCRFAPANYSFSVNRYPYYGYEGDNSTSGKINEGNTAKVSVYWNDPYGDLKNAIMRTNLTGSWINSSVYTFGTTPGYSNFTIDTVNHPSETICWVVWANDTIGNMNESMNQHCFDVIDVTSPTYQYDSDNSTGSVNEDGIVKVSAYWNDNYELDYAILRTNETGSWANRSIIEFTGTPQYSNFSVDTSDRFGETICWLIWTNDTTGNFNVLMGEHCFSVIDTETPLWRYLGTNMSSVAYNNQTITLSAQGYDDVGLWLAVLATNETGAWVNHSVYGSPKSVGNSTGWSYSNFTWYNTTFHGRLWFRIWYRDNSSNVNVTEMYSLAVLDSVLPRMDLQVPLDKSFNKSKTIEFSFVTVTNDDIAGCYLWTNETTWSLKKYNSTKIANNSVSKITETFSSDGEYVWTVQCNDTSGNYNMSSNRTVKADSTPPVYQYDQDDSGGSAEAGEVMSVSARWTDLMTDISTAVFRTNETGSWENRSVYALSTKPDYSNFSIDTTSRPRETICWVIWTNDTMGHMNASMGSHCFDVVDTFPPRWHYNSTDSTSSASYVKHRTYWEDSGGMAGYVFSLDNCTGSFVNDSWVPTGDLAYWVNVTKYISETVGCTMRWRVWANDTGGNWNDTGIIEYKTTEDRPPRWSYNQTNSTLAGKNIMHSVNWSEDSGLSGYVFSWNNGTNWTDGSCASYATQSQCQAFGCAWTMKQKSILIHYTGWEANQAGWYDPGANSGRTSGSSRCDDSGNCGPSGSFKWWIQDDLTDSYTDQSFNFTYDGTNPYDIVNVTFYSQEDAAAPWEAGEYVLLECDNTEVWRQVPGECTPGTYCIYRVQINTTQCTFDTVTRIEFTGNPGLADATDDWWIDGVNVTGFYGACTGTPNYEFKNDSWVRMTGFNNWSNVTKIVNTTVGALIKWKVYANDTSGNWNVTDTFWYNTTIDTTPPNSTYVSVNESFPKNGWYVKFSTYWSDAYVDVDDWIFSWNLTENGVWQNVSYGSFTPGKSGWSNITIQIPAYANRSYGFRFYVNDTEGNLNITETHEFTVSGNMIVSLTKPLGGQNLGLNATFMVNATILCVNGTCGTVSGSARYNTSSQYPDTDISTSEASPLYVMDGTNPRNCQSNPLFNGGYCNITWIVNATGPVGNMYKIGALFQSDQNNVYDNHTENNTVTIVSCVMDVTLGWESMNFGSLMPGQTANPAPGNPENMYNITIEPLTTCGIDLYINSTELRHKIEPSYQIPSHNITFSNTTNDFGSGYNLTGEWGVIKLQTSPGTNVTTYYWVNTPSGIRSGEYNGTITIEGVEHGTGP